MATKPETGALWGDRRFVLVWSGQVVSFFGDNVTTIALPWLVLAVTHSPLDAALIVAARYVPMILLGLAAGLAADRLPRRAILIGCDLLRGVALASVVLVALSRHAPPLWLLALVVVALGIGQVGFQAAYWAWLPDVLGEARLGRATAAIEAADAAGALAGPAVGGIVIQLFGPALALGADALSFFGSALALWRVPLPPRVPETAVDARPGALWRAALAGAHVILTTAALRLLRGLATTLYFYTSAFGVLLATLTQTRLHLPPLEAGIVFAGAGAGGIIGSALAPRILEKPWQQGLAGTMAVSGIGAVTLALVAAQPQPTSVLLATLATAALDGAASLSFILLTTQITLQTPAGMRGRVNAAGGIYASLARLVGVLVLGALANRFGVVPAFLLLTAGFVAASVAAGRAFRTASAAVPPV